MFRRMIPLGTLVVILGALALSVRAQPSSPEPIAFAYADTTGTTGLPWQRSNAFLNEPLAVASDRDGFWVLNTGGRNAVRFGTGALEEVGRAGSLASLYGWPARRMTDIAIGYEPRPLGSRPTPEPTPDPEQGPVAPPQRTVWVVDSDAHVVAGIPVAPDGRQGVPRVLGEHGVPGADETHFDSPGGVAADPFGYLYISDTNNHRVLVLGPDLRVEATIGEAGRAGADNAHFDRPLRLEADGEGRLFVADSGNARVQGFDVSNPAAPRWVRTYGAGAGATALTRPQGIGTDASFLYVADGASGRVQIYEKNDGDHFRTLDGRSTESCGVNDPEAWWDFAADVTLTRYGTIAVALPNWMQVVTCDAYTRAPRTVYGSRLTPYVPVDGVLNSPSAVVETADGLKVIAELEGHRVTGLPADGAPGWSLGTAGRAGQGDLLSAPSDIGLLPGDQSVVADSGNGRLVVVDRLGRRTAEWGVGTLTMPKGLAVLPGGGVAVADGGSGLVQLFGASGSPAGALSGPGGPLAFASPADVAPDGAGGWWISDAGRHVVAHVSATGAPLSTIGRAGSPGDAFDRLNMPHGLAVDGEGRLLVADTGNDRVQVFDSSGDYLTTIGGTAGDGTGGLREPRGVAVAPDGRILVADTYNHRIQAFRLARPPWQSAAVNGFGERHTQSVTTLLDFEGWLFAGTDHPDGARLWQRADSVGWSPSATGGFGDAEEVAVSALASHANALYAATENRIVGTGPDGEMTFSTRGGDVWRSTDTGASWQRVAEDGFGVPSNAAAASLASFKGTLYAGTRSGEPVAGTRQAAQLWRSPTGDAGSWQRVPIELFTREDWTRNTSIHALTVYSGSLYAGTCAQGGPQIWASTDGAVWRAAGALEPGGDPRDATPALGVSSVACVTDFEEFDGRLYAGLGNEPREAGRFFANGQAAVWRCTVCNGTDWEPASAPGMGDPSSRGRAALGVLEEPPFRYLYAALGNLEGGIQIWRSPDGQDWEPQLADGFGDDNNTDVGSGAAVAPYRGHLYVGTRNLAHGGELWSSPGGRPGVVPTPPGAEPSPTPRPLPQPPTGRARYEKSGEWPIGAIAAANVIGVPVDMAVTDDGSVYILDSAPVRVLRLGPDGQWRPAFGGTGSGPDRITRTNDNGMVAAIAVDSASGRVYVSDLGTERVLVYDLDGRFVAAWDQIAAVDLFVRPDGTLWVADVLAGSVRRVDRSGAEIERLGAFAPDDMTGMLQLLEAVEDTGGRLWVTDMGGSRLRVYQRVGGVLQRIRNMNMLTPTRRDCGADRLQPLGDDIVLVGRCVFHESRITDRLPDNHAGNDLYGTGMRTVNLGSGLYYALAIYDIERLNPDNLTQPAVVKYFDAGFDIVAGQWRGELFAAGTATDDAVLGPVRLSTAPDGSLFLSDALGFRRFSPEGSMLEELATEAYPSRSVAMAFDPQLIMGTGERGKVFGVAVAATGRLQIPSQVAIYGDSVLRRRCVARVCADGLYVQTIWDSVLEAGLRRVPVIEYNYAVAHEPTKNQLVLLQLYIDSASQIEFPARLLLFPAGEMGRKIEVPLEGRDRQALWTDVDAGRDGRILVLDTLRDLVQVFDAGGRDLGRVSTPKDAWRVAAGPNGEIFVLTTYGHVVRMGSDGTVLSRFVGLPNHATPFTAQVDLAVDDAGRVFVADDLYQQVTVFSPAGTEDDVLEGGRCRLAGDKWVDPTDIQLGDQARLLLTLFGTCGYQEEPSDIVLAVNAAPNVDVQNLQVARQILAVVDLDVHRVGVVSYIVNSKVDAPLTHDRDRLILALYNVSSSRIVGCGVSTESAMLAADDVFDEAPGRRKVLIIINPPTDPDPGRCAYNRDTIAAEAQRLRAQGVLVVAVNGPLTPPTLAADSEILGRVQVAPRGQGVGRPALRRSITRVWPDHVLVSGVLSDTLPANIDYVPGSAAPPAAWDPASRTLTWQLANLDRTRAHRFALSIRPREEGLWPTNVQASAAGVDGWGNAASVTLPIPRIRVYGEIPPTPTPFPIRTPGPSPTPVPSGPLYLPIVMRTVACSPLTRNADVALVLDTSGSMSESTRPGGETKFEAAKAAAGAFLGNLVPGRDQAALIQFNSTAEVIVQLSDDPALVRAGLDRLTQAAGTRIDSALETAQAELTGPRRRTSNNPVLVLLTDGEPSGTTPEEVRARAQDAKAAGILVFTVGLGLDVDHDLLRDVATQSDWYFHAPDTSDLASIYDRIAYSIPCREQWP